MLTKHGSVRTFGGDTPGIKSCLDFLAFRTQHGPARARTSHQNRAQHFPVQAPYIMELQVYMGAKRVPSLATRAQTDAKSARGANNRLALGSTCRMSSAAWAFPKTTTPKTPITPLQNDPQQHHREAKHINFRVSRAGTRSPDPESVRRELSKSGLASHFGQQTCGFASRGGGPLPESFRCRLQRVLPKTLTQRDTPAKISPSGTQSLRRWQLFCGAPGGSHFGHPNVAVS
jgi:hypothetical protein